MSRLISFVLIWVSVATAVQAASGDALARALELMRQGDWAGAQIAARGDGQVAMDVIAWHRLRAGLGEAPEVMDFLSRNPDWPGLDYLREKSEAAMVAARHEDVRAFYDDVLPQTGTGALSLARAFQAEGEQGLAEATVVMAWRTLVLSGEERAAFLADWGDLLSDHHVARLDYALWKGWTRNARAVVPLVEDGWQKLAEARLALRAQDGGVDARIAAVPEALAGDPGLAYERFRWRMDKRRFDDAAELILERSASPATIGEAWAWARDRRDLARRVMREGDFAKAYRIASQHHLVEGSDFADLEWLSGFLALRFLDRPEAALRHFEAFRGAVFTPISLGRAGYWLGRAQEAMGNDAAAQEAYAFGGAYQTSFYGLLAAERAGLPADPLLGGAEAFPDWQAAGFVEGSVFHAVILLMAAGEDRLAERFVTHLAESQDRVGMGQLGAMLAAKGRPHMQVMLGKRAAQFGHEIHAPYYALHSGLTERQFDVPTELVLAIARRESEFDPVVVSHAGARGFMQLMPGTAREVAGDLGLDYSSDRLLNDPGYNATLGSAYLAELAERFDGNAVMMAAGYNAGPSRPLRWMEDNGDPREGDMDIVDWIELIPFNETRNYVMRVTESLPIYRARLGEPALPVPFSQELIGSTMRAGQRG